MITRQNILLHHVMNDFVCICPGAFSGHILTIFSFLQNSRLHFIGTWRYRYRKRFCSLSDGFNCTSSNIKASALKTAIMHVDMVISIPLAVEYNFGLWVFIFFLLMMNIICLLSLPILE